MQLIALFRLGFPSAPYLKYLTLLHTVTRWLVLQKARRRTLKCFDRLKTHGFRFYFTPLPGFFSPFPHGTIRYRWQRVFSLRRWSAQIHARLLVSRATWEMNRRSIAFDYETFTLYG